MSFLDVAVNVVLDNSDKITCNLGFRMIFPPQSGYKLICCTIWCTNSSTGRVAPGPEFCSNLLQWAIIGEVSTRWLYWQPSWLLMMSILNFSMNDNIGRHLRCRWWPSGIHESAILYPCIEKIDLSRHRGTVWLFWWRNSKLPHLGGILVMHKINVDWLSRV